jgi:hypothetical protein
MLHTFSKRLGPTPEQKPLSHALSVPTRNDEPEKGEVAKRKVSSYHACSGRPRIWGHTGYTRRLSRPGLPRSPPGHVDVLVDMFPMTMRNFCRAALASNASIRFARSSPPRIPLPNGNALVLGLWRPIHSTPPDRASNPSGFWTTTWQPRKFLHAHTSWSRTISKA